MNRLESKRHEEDLYLHVHISAKALRDRISREYKWSEQDNYLEDLQRVLSIGIPKNPESVNALVQGIPGEYIFTVEKRVYTYTLFHDNLETVLENYYKSLPVGKVRERYKAAAEIIAEAYKL